MARYTGPKSRISRRFGEPIFGPDKALNKKNLSSWTARKSEKKRKTI